MEIIIIFSRHNIGFDTVVFVQKCSLAIPYGIKLSNLWNSLMVDKHRIQLPAQSTYASAPEYFVPHHG